MLHAADQTDWVLPWQEVTTRIGTAVGVPAQAKQEVQEVEDLIARTRAENPQFEGKTAALVILWSDGNLRAFSPEAARAQLLTQLGFTAPAALKDRFRGQAELRDLRRELRPPRVRLPALRQLREGSRRDGVAAAFTNLNVVETGGLISLDPIVSDAVSMPNPLTIPFVLEDFVAKINQTIAGR